MKSKPIRRFHHDSIFDLMDKSALSSDERDAVDAALREQKKSRNPKWRVGVSVLGESGEIVSVFNESVGPTNHAEQVGISEFYRRMPAGSKIKAIALAGAREGEEVIRCDAPYGDDVSLDEVECVYMCGKCGEFATDCTRNTKDVVIILVTVTGQILRTSLRSLFPRIHTSFTVPIAEKDGKLYPVPSTDDGSFYTQR
jgi:cytidine deaminase